MVIGVAGQHGHTRVRCLETGHGTDGEVNGDTVSRLVPCTKTFTSAGGAGHGPGRHVKLDDPVAKYLPKGVRVPSFDGCQSRCDTLRAGFGAAVNVYNFSSKDTGAAMTPTRGKFVCLPESHQLTNAPGAKFEYSNAGMSLLGHAM